MLCVPATVVAVRACSGSRKAVSPQWVWAGAARAGLPHAQSTVPVERLAAAAVGDVRRAEQRRRDPEDARALKLKGAFSARWNLRVWRGLISCCRERMNPAKRGRANAYEIGFA